MRQDDVPSSERGGDETLHLVGRGTVEADLRVLWFTLETLT
ncbi:hypothetical protein ACFYVR_24690 [Rhodococcus sp. NPDC003318]